MSAPSSCTVCQNDIDKWISEQWIPYTTYEIECILEHLEKYPALANRDVSLRRYTVMLRRAVSILKNALLTDVQKQRILSQHRPISTRRTLLTDRRPAEVSRNRITDWYSATNRQYAGAPTYHGVDWYSTTRSDAPTYHCADRYSPIRSSTPTYQGADWYTNEEDQEDTRPTIGHYHSSVEEIDGL